MENRSKLPLYLFLQDISLDGGCERVVVNMANEFIKYYENVHIVSNFQTNLSLKFEINEQVKIKYLHKNISFQEWKNKHLLKIFFKSGFVNRLFYSFGFTTKLYQYVDNVSKSDLSIIMLNGYDTPFYKKKHIKLIGVDHSSFPFYKKKSFLYKKIWFPIVSFMNRKLDLVTILTDSEIEYWRWFKKPIAIMPNFINNIPNEITKIENRENIILSIGRMNTNQKGFDRLIKIYSKIAKKYPNWKMHIFGNGNLKKEYINLINNLGMSNYIKIFDFTNNPNLEYNKSSIYAMCSRTEGFPMVLIEAMSFGLPVISYDLDYGPSVIIDNENTGFLIPNDNEILFYKKLEQLMMNVELRNKMSFNSIDKVKTNFSSDVIIKKWIKLFEEII